MAAYPRQSASRRLRSAAVACATLGLLAFAFIAPRYLLPRPFFGLGDASHPPFAFRVDDDRVGFSWFHAGRPRQPWAGQTNHFGVRYNVYTYDGSDLSVPTWYLLLPAAGWLALTLIARHRDRRRAASACRSCGYDLTGNVSGVCPECGTPVKGEVLP